MSGGRAQNCTFVKNTTEGPGGGLYTYVATSVNCIVYFNEASLETDDNYYDEHGGQGTVMRFCCARPLPAGTGNLEADPLMAGIRNPHILLASPCRGAGDTNAVAAGQVDIDGETRISGGQVDIGCDEYIAGAVTGAITAAIYGDTNTVFGVPELLGADLGGKVAGFVWRVEREGEPPRLLEAHIERGVAIASGREYLADAKFRILLLRPRADLPALARDPLLPHRAAARVLAETQTRHIPYDFAMDFTDPARLFCSEVASWAYREEGVTLWMGLSHISSPGLARWLGAFGVTHFETQEPSDLEADPQLAVVAEWRDLDSLWKDHVDNAVVEAMLAGAEGGQPLDYPWYLLPAGRVAKAWSAVSNAFGRIGPVPEGMSAPAALRNRTFGLRHAERKKATLELAATFERQHGYRPPYWQLVRLARSASTAP